MIPRGYNTEGTDQRICKLNQVGFQWEGKSYDISIEIQMS